MERAEGNEQGVAQVMNERRAQTEFAPWESHPAYVPAAHQLKACVLGL